MIRKTMWAVLVIGVALIVAPFAMGLPDKADGGQQMIDAFGPIMDEQNVQTTADYYYDVFVPLGDLVPAMTQENIDTFNGYLAGFSQLGDVPGLDQMEQDFSGLLGLMDANVPIFEQVPAGLDHYEPLVTTMQEQQGNYDKVAALPEFTLFTWFFLVPGVLLVALAAAGLVLDRQRTAELEAVERFMTVA